jgi:hypothetical protein
MLSASYRIHKLSSLHRLYLTWVSSWQLWNLNLSSYQLSLIFRFKLDTEGAFLLNELGILVSYKIRGFIIQEFFLRNSWFIAGVLFINVVATLILLDGERSLLLLLVNATNNIISGIKHSCTLPLDSVTSLSTF